MSHHNIEPLKDAVWSVNLTGSSSVVLVCEHASNEIPAPYKGLGLSSEDRESHAAWDPGAMATARFMSTHLDAVLIAGGVSRLLYDCNRPPHAPDAMPTRSEIIDVPGNIDLTQPERDARVDAIYRPFQSALGKAIQRVAHPVIVTIHSFTPVYHGVTRAVEIGILHDCDTRLADAMLQVAGAHTHTNVLRNAPYGPQNGVTHTLTEHAISGGHLNIMLEIRNDLIKTAAQQEAMAIMLSKWIADAFAGLQEPGTVQCQG